MEAPGGNGRTHQGTGMAAARDGRGLTQRLFAALSRLGATEEAVAAEPAPAGGANGEGDGSECERLARFLAAELRLPLASLARLGARCAASSDPELCAVGRALARESERLDVLVTNTIELGLLGEEPSPRGLADLREVVEKVVAGHRSLVEGLAIRVRVADCSRAPLVAADRGELLGFVAALYEDLLERVPRGGCVELRLRELHGLVRLDAVAVAAVASVCEDRTTIRRAREIVSRHGGELWEVAGSPRGFGFTLPRHARGEGRPRSVRLAPGAAPDLKA